MSTEDLSNFSMLDLFRVETETQAQALTAGLLALERDPTAAVQLEICMRGAHSLKGAARIIDQPTAVSIAHAMEDCFVAAQRGLIVLAQQHIDALLRAVDLLVRVAKTPEADLGEWAAGKKEDVDAVLISLAGVLSGESTVEGNDDSSSPSAAPVESRPAVLGAAGRPASDRVLRVSAESLNRLLALASESLVESRWLKPFSESFLKLKRLHHELGVKLENLRDALPPGEPNERARVVQVDVQRRLADCQQFLSHRLAELDMFDRRSSNLSHRLYDEALTVRMRPFSDGVQGFPRMVRDVGRSLGKQVLLEIVGEATPVDRDILDRLETPLNHLLRNAIDHGIELPEERLAAGKAPEGQVRLEARHSAGLLQITVDDDGRGIDPAELRKAVIARNLTTAETAARLSDAELMEFLFLPGFTMKENVTEISGRGVGLDAVQAMIKEVRGAVRVSSRPGQGSQFQLQLPLTLSVIRTLLVDIGGEPYAFPLAYIVRTIKLPRGKIELVEGRQHFDFDGRRVGLITAHQVLGGREAMPGDEWPVVVIGDARTVYGLVVDRFIGERELVVHPLDPRLGKVKDVAAAALMADGAPILIVDVDDMMRSVEKLITAGRLSQLRSGEAADEGKKRKRVLVVDDSLTVRELERKLLSNHGYDVEVAVDGMDGWNAVRIGQFSLVISDIDMPRMDGIELVTLIKKDPNLKSLPVMIVSYKDREEDRRRGLEAGADYYLTKGSFHDETLLQAVVDLVGEAFA